MGVDIWEVMILFAPSGKGLKGKGKNKSVLYRRLPGKFLEEKQKKRGGT